MDEWMKKLINRRMAELMDGWLNGWLEVDIR